MSKWIITVADEDDTRVQELAEYAEKDYVWIKEYAGDAVVVDEIQKADNASLRVGVTGPLKGMTWAQRKALAKLFGNPRISRLIHGGAKGVDEQADELYRACVTGEPVVDVYPAHKSQGRYAEPSYRDIERDPLVRDHLIAENLDILFHVTGGWREVRRAGDWATHRYAMALSRTVLVIWPDGAVTVGGFGCRLWRIRTAPGAGRSCPSPGLRLGSVNAISAR